eukprot:COSAG06_NODE_30211_length_542_cov_18.182844_1_plen_43_part_10
MTRRIVHAIKVELDAWLGGQRGSGGVAVPAAAAAGSAAGNGQ